MSDVTIPEEGPCSAWITGDEVAECCSATSGTDPSQFDTWAVEASMILFELSGRKYAGGCGPITVRPCRQPCQGWLGAGYPGAWYWEPWEGNWGWWTDAGGGPLCGCGWLPRVKLSGYPVTEIVEVTIDGNVVDPATYRLDNYRFLTRMGYLNGEGAFVQRWWPACQNLTLEEDQPGTFAVTYNYGVAPPLAGVEAAKQLACQLSLACAGSSECVLPQGVTKYTRQGVEVERALMATWAQTVTSRGVKSGAWGTGMALVDAFLSTYNPGGLRRRPLIVSPDVQQFAPKLGR